LTLLTFQVQDRINLDERETYSSGRRLRRRHRGGVTYISRIQAVQNAVHQQLNDMYRTHPNRRVGLVLFNDEVCLNIVIVLDIVCCCSRLM
jgi:hypothetical protein